MRKLYEPNFLRDKHVGYLLKFIKKIPADIPFDEAHRVCILFFIISSLDLLGALDEFISYEEKQEIIKWIYTYQVEINDNQDTSKYQQHDETTQQKGISDYLYNSCKESIPIFFKTDTHAGFRATSLIDSSIPLECGNISMTYCSLASLCILGDDLSQVNSKAIISGLKYLQQPNGNFSPCFLGGEEDMRIVYCAVAVSAILNDWSGMDTDRCALFIKNSLSYEGGFAQCPGAEAHGGSTFCALASLKLMSKFDKMLSEQEKQNLISWCMNRFEEGFTGRANKDQDTCYTFWVGACLVMLGHFDSINQDCLVDFLLDAQTGPGGLCKYPGSYVDPLHTYLGLAGLSFVNENVLKSRNISLRPTNPLLNISERAREHLKKLHLTQ